MIKQRSPPTMRLTLVAPSILQFEVEHALLPVIGDLFPGLLAGLRHGGLALGLIHGLELLEDMIPDGLTEHLGLALLVLLRQIVDQVRVRLPGGRQGFPVLERPGLRLLEKQMQFDGRERLALQSRPPRGPIGRHEKVIGQLLVGDVDGITVAERDLGQEPFRGLVDGIASAGPIDPAARQQPTPCLQRLQRLVVVLRAVPQEGLVDALLHQLRDRLEGRVQTRVHFQQLAECVVVVPGRSHDVSNAQVAHRSEMVDDDGLVIGLEDRRHFVEVLLGIQGGVQARTEDLLELIVQGQHQGVVPQAGPDHFLEKGVRGLLLLVNGRVACCLVGGQSLSIFLGAWRCIAQARGRIGAAGRVGRGRRGHVVRLCVRQD
mmetsp:Transcript_25699/g.51501  ORF Transcript_25699/g.51501 Transcript_25699/m.51501 type:complete len:375 (-) Transcript_25699:42-1166(-)